MNDLNKHNAVRYSNGPKGTVLLCMEKCGIGDDMHALPVVWQMVRDGLHVVVNCRPFRNAIWQAVGARVQNEREPFGLVWSITHEHLYERIISLAHWGGWECGELGYHTQGTIEQFAEIVGHRVPDTFSWLDVLRPKAHNGEPYVLFNPHSVEHWRTLPPEQADRVERELLMQYGAVRRMGATECATVEELFALINGASLVVTVEGGVSNIAGAFGRDVVVLTGMTDIGATMEQYTKYLPTWSPVEVRGATVYGCNAPCYRQESRGFINGKCCGVSDEPLCLARLDIDLIAEATQAFHNIGA